MAKKKELQNQVDDEAVTDAATEENSAPVGDENVSDAPDSLAPPSVSEPEASALADADARDSASILTSVTGIHAQVEQAARKLAASPQHQSGPLNKVEILIGGLMLALPEAIAATDDAALVESLKELQGML